MSVAERIALSLQLLAVLLAVQRRLLERVGSSEFGLGQREDRVGV